MNTLSGFRLIYLLQFSNPSKCKTTPHEYSTDPFYLKNLIFTRLPLIHRWRINGMKIILISSSNL